MGIFTYFGPCGTSVCPMWAIKPWKSGSTQNLYTEVRYRNLTVTLTSLAVALAFDVVATLLVCRHLPNDGIR